jgi:hypothetical protein
MPSCPRPRTALARLFASAVHALAVTGIAFGHLGHAAAARAVEAPAAPPPAAAAAPELEELVGPIALYPDELLALALPASTYPLEIVQAARFLEKYENDPELQPDEAWDPSILGLLNYPEVIELMNDDLNWTWQLGEAVANRQQDVMDAVQSFRAKVDAAGNLASNEQVTVVKESGGEQPIIVIESASPEVIYVPQYEPSTVVVYQPAPVVVYSHPYPYYYSPAAAFWTGMFAGAAIGWGLSWGHWGHHSSSIKVNRNVNINVDRPTRPSTPDRPGAGAGNRPGGGDQWRPNPDRGKQGGRPGADKAKRPTAGTGARPGAGTRPGGGSKGPGPGVGTRPGGGSKGPGPGATRPGAGSGSRPSAGTPSRPSAGGRDLTRSPSGRSAYGGSSMGSYGNGARARSSGSRGAASRGAHRGGGRGGGGRGGRR